MLDMLCNLIWSTFARILIVSQGVVQPAVAPRRFFGVGRIGGDTDAR
jgi:hypothetical protein